MVNERIYYCWSRSFFAALGLLLVVFAQPSTAQDNRPDIVLQAGHTVVVQSILFARDNKWIATGDYDGTIRIWELTGRELRALQGHSAAIITLAASRNGKVLASLSNDRTVRLWSVENGDLLTLITVDTETRSMAMSADGRYIAIGGNGGAIEVHDSASRGKPRKYAEHKAPVTALLFAEDGKRLISAGLDRAVKIWNVDTGKRVHNLSSDEQVVSALFMGAQDTLLVGASEAGSIRTWDLPSRKTLVVRQLTTTSRVTAAQAILGDRVLAITEDHILHDLNARRNDEPTGKRSLAVGAPEYTPQAAAVSRDGSHVAAENGDGSVTIFDPSTGASKASLRGYTTGSYGVAYSHDARWLASAGIDKTVRLWDLRDGVALPPLRGHKAAVMAIAFHPDNRTVVSGSLDKTIRVWDVLSRRSGEPLTGHQASISSVAISKSGRILVSGSADKNIGIWLTAGNVPPRFLPGHTAEVSAVCITADETTILSSSGDGTLRLWDVETGAQKGPPIDTKSGWINSVALSPDGRTAVTGGRNGIVRFWDLGTGRMIHDLPFHKGPVNGVSFTDNGRTVLSSGFDGKVAMWDVAVGRRSAVFDSRMGSVFATAGVATGDLFTAATSNGLAMWSRGNNRQIASLLSINDEATGRGDWMVVTPEGFFDGSPAAWSRLAWRFDQNTFNVQPVEVFFSEFFASGLLRDVAKTAKVPSMANIASKDRTQPKVELKRCETEPGIQDDKREVNVCITVSASSAGARDLRLFRNGTLVRSWRGDVLEGAESVTRKANVRLVAGTNRFTAYAFNKDNIKSVDPQLLLEGAGDLARKGNAHVLSIGINRHTNAAFDLGQAVNDAREFQDEIGRRQTALGTFDRVVPTTLIDEAATKANILASLSELAEKVRPEDTLTIYFAGHGIAQNNRFYLVPHDLGYSGSRRVLTASEKMTIFSHSISDEDLGSAIEAIDARRIVLIIDACNSGQLLEADDFRQAPMNSKGLAQLAYEKGMYILTASQSYQVAKEAPTLGHGFLTYALIEEGLKDRKADWAPTDGSIIMREWLDFATDRVPQLDRQVYERMRSRDLVGESGGPPRVNTQALQRPKVFYRREVDFDPIVIAQY